jgi:hypothetical protein
VPENTFYDCNNIHTEMDLVRHQGLLKCMFGLCYWFSYGIRQITKIYCIVQDMHLLVCRQWTAPIYLTIKGISVNMKTIMLYSTYHYPTMLPRANRLRAHHLKRRHSYSPRTDDLFTQPTRVIYNLWLELPRIWNVCNALEGSGGCK